MTAILQQEKAARERLHEDARSAHRRGESASDWEQGAEREQREAVALVGRKGMEALVQVVWFKGRTGQRRPRRGGR